MPDSATWKQHDLEPPPQSTLANADGDPINLTTADAVYFLMRPVGGGTALRVAATVVDATNGVVKHTWDTSGAPWGTGHTDTVGTYDQEWEIMWPTSRPQTVPNESYNTIVIVDDLD